MQDTGKRPLQKKQYKTKNKQESAPIYSSKKSYCIEVHSASESVKDSKKSEIKVNSGKESKGNLEVTSKDTWALNLSAIIEENSIEEDSLRFSRPEVDEELKAKSP